MTTPVFTYSTQNGKRVVSVDGSFKHPTDRTTAPAGTHDIKTTLTGGKLISIAGDLYEPLDVAASLNKI
ncbi:hypothetical protein [Methylotenera versatilis]|uniref:Uncharacterized protein n=1 Tax=Methylotenera versatilis (strain 301) TaxID=666681 RepID=D7DI83_METV0|nr:hypothetical protein [Methylotenera versatilis]ADI29768.1 hypothetical protein M301_1385 [Methylotenera versatilis 301]